MNKNIEYVQKLNDDLIAQFRGQPNTRILLSAIARQFQDLYEAQTQLKEMRSLLNSEGKQLDGIGDILVLSRSDAAKLEFGKSDAREIDDKTYRKYLYYKMFLNTSSATRREIMKALRFFWNEAPLYYSEEQKYPATIFIDTPELAPDVPIEELLDAPIVKPAGVRFIVRVRTKTQNDLYKLRIRGLSNIKITRTQVDETPHRADVGLFKLRLLNSASVKITKTQTEETKPAAVEKSLRIVHRPMWKISKTDIGDLSAVSKTAQRYEVLATVKITKTPIAAHGGD